MRAVHIIDDDEAVRDSLAVLLELNNLPVATYGSAPAFLAALAAGAEGCVVTDVQMPQMSGLELLTELQAAGCRLPVIVATARAAPGLAEEVLALGARVLLEKPFSPDALVDAVRGAMTEA